jgi:hypothetical protein
LADALAGKQPVQAGHLKVEYDHHCAHALREGNRFLPVDCQEHVLTDCGKFRTQDAADDRIVVRDNDAGDA